MFVMVLLVLFVTTSTSCGRNGDIDGDGCRRGLLADRIDGDGLGVKNGPGGESIP